MSIILSKASDLDPRYHELKFLSDAQKMSVWEQLENEVNEYQVTSITTIERDYSEESNSDEEPVEPPAKKMRSLMADSDEESEDENQLQKYKSISAKISHNQDPLLWWKYNEKIYPAVSQLANKYLTAVATSVPCERLFSEAGQVITKRRNRLSPDRVNQLLFLNSYLKEKDGADTDNVMV